MTESEEEGLLAALVQLRMGELGAVDVNVAFMDCERDKVVYRMTSALYVPFAGAMSENELLETADSVSEVDYEMVPHFVALRGTKRKQSATRPVHGWLSFVIQDDDVVYMKKHPEWLEEVLACFGHQTIVTFKTNCDDAKTVFDQFRRELGRFTGTSGFIKVTK